MYSDFLQRNELFNLLENNDDFTKEDVDILEEIASNPKIGHKDFVNTLHKIFNKYLEIENKQQKHYYENSND